MYIDIRTDLTDAVNELEGFEKERKQIKKNLLRTAAQQTRKKVKASYSQYLHKRSGQLYKSIKYTVWRDGTRADVYPTKKYGFMLAAGFTSPKNPGSLLTFKIGDKWIRTYGPINVSARKWTADPADRYLKSSEFDRDLENKLQKEVERIEKKYAKAAANEN